MEPTTQSLVGGALFASELAHNEFPDNAYSTSQSGRELYQSTREAQGFS